ncbi:MAG TPA: hypothetical protein VER14_04840 [Phototrophicaceae bacterium]|nr:hypothetical protein [Phototrophicaceae bacterium]
MAEFFFKPDPIDGVEFKPVKIDIHLGVIKIVDEEIYHDFQPNNTESVIVGTDRKEVLARIQRGFEYQFRAYGKAKNGEHNPDMDYNAKQAWKRLQRLIIYKEDKGQL